MLVIIPKTLIMMITIDKRRTILKEDNNVAEDDGGDGGDGEDGENGGDDGEDSDAGKADKQQ